MNFYKAKDKLNFKKLIVSRFGKRVQSPYNITYFSAKKSAYEKMH